MNIKPLVKERIRIDVKEWNEEIEIYFRPIGGIETLVFNDYFLEFYSKQRTPEERFNSGFKAALMVLVDKDGNAALAESDRDALEQASIAPLVRMFNVGLSALREGDEVDTAKKN